MNLNTELKLHKIKVKFDAKFGCVMLLRISFLHFRNASLLHTLTQLTVKSDVLKLLS